VVLKDKDHKTYMRRTSRKRKKKQEEEKILKLIENKRIFHKKGHICLKFVYPTIPKLQPINISSLVDYLFDSKMKTVQFLGVALFLICSV
jgi:uncharacterized protein YaiL (DUF2058 family)